MVGSSWMSCKLAALTIVLTGLQVDCEQVPQGHLLPVHAQAPVAAPGLPDGGCQDAQVCYVGAEALLKAPPSLLPDHEREQELRVKPPASGRIYSWAARMRDCSTTVGQKGLGLLRRNLMGLRQSIDAVLFYWRPRCIHPDLRMGKTTTPEAVTLLLWK